MKRYHKIIFTCMALVIILLISLLIIERKKCSSYKESILSSKTDEKEELEYNCSFTQTWKVYNLLDNYTGHHPDISYVILEKFQTFIPYSHKIPSDLKSQLEEGKYYEFTYHIKGKGIINNIDEVIEYLIPESNANESQSKIIVTLSINKTDKLGLEQIQENICKGNNIANKER